jgi:hypothetical protein
MVEQQLAEAGFQGLHSLLCSWHCAPLPGAEPILFIFISLLGVAVVLVM